MTKLKGCSQMVVNMLRRDNTPVRTEAAELLLVEVANIELQYELLKTQKQEFTEVARQLKVLREELFASDSTREIGFKINSCLNKTYCS